MRVLITGATGMIGGRLVRDRLERGDEIVVVTRDVAAAASAFESDSCERLRMVQGNPAVPGDWQALVDGCDAVVHLAGANVAAGRWTRQSKKLIVNSRIDSTHQVVEAIAAASQRPKVLVSASATGIYGEHGGDEIAEDAPTAKGDFLADLTACWEAEAAKARQFGVRTALVRIGAVLDPRGGLLGGLIRPFQMYLGGPIGSGRQYISWIHWRDLIGLIDLALYDPSIDGPLNGVSPNPVPNRDFCRALARSLRRPSWLPMPGFALRTLVGEIARYALTSQRVVPTRAEQAGYRFVYPELRSALEELIGEIESTATDSPG